MTGSCISNKMKKKKNGDEIVDRNFIEDIDLKITLLNKNTKVS